MEIFIQASVFKHYSVLPKVNLLYIDYGNREVSTAVKCVSIPAVFAGPTAFAHEYSLACAALPKDVVFSLRFSLRFFFFLNSFRFIAGGYTRSCNCFWRRYQWSAIIVECGIQRSQRGLCKLNRFRCKCILKYNANL